MNKLVIGSTQSGKTTAEIKALVEDHAKDCALVICDPHSTLAWGTFVHLIARGFKRRILIDQLCSLDRCLAWQFLTPASTTQSPLKRRAQNDERGRAFADLIGRRRRMDSSSLATHPLTEEWLILATSLFLEQDNNPSLKLLGNVFAPHHKDFKQLLTHCQHEDIPHRFQQIADGKVAATQYNPARRIIESTIKSPAFLARCGTNFQLDTFLNGKGILILQGGFSDTLSEDSMRIILGSAVLHTIHYIRTRTRPFPRVILVIDEATNFELIGSHEARALAELQKAGLDIHILVQAPNFPSAFITNQVFTNCVRHEWFYAASSDVAQLGAADLGDPSYKETLRNLRTGERCVRNKNRVYTEYVKLLEDPWAFPGLSEKKARKALQEILLRREYHTPSLSSRNDNDPPAANASQKSTPKPPSPEPLYANIGI